MVYKVELFKDRKKQWRFRIKAGNGQIVAQSEGYTRKHNAKKLLHNLIDGELSVIEE